MHVLIVEDDTALASQLSAALLDARHTSLVAKNGLIGLTAAADGGFDVMVVDRMLPELDGLALVRQLRERGDNTPVLVLSALGQVDDRVTGLRAGGDDYLSKPYAFSELLARLEVLVRRSDSPDAPPTTRQVGSLTLDRITHEAEREGERITLLPREYRLLDYLMHNADRLVTRTMLLENVWDLHFDPQTNVIDVHVSRLRAKIDKGYDTPLLHTVRGRGYRLAAVAEED